MEERLKRQLEFALEIDKEKNVAATPLVCSGHDAFYQNSTANAVLPRP